MGIERLTVREGVKVYDPDPTCGTATELMGARVAFEPCERFGVAGVLVTMRVEAGSARSQRRSFVPWTSIGSVMLAEE